MRKLAAGMGVAVSIAEADLTHTTGNLEQLRAARGWHFFERRSRADWSTAWRRRIPAPTRRRPCSSVSCAAQARAGLAGIRPVTATGIVRPLIDVDRAAVEIYLRERGIAWREDSTNRSRRFRPQPHPPRTAAAARP